VLDEPTNDLDTETLEMLEERLVDFAGTLLVVSHDRAFLNNVVTSTIVFEPGGAREYVGGYDDWIRQRGTPGAASGAAERDATDRTLAKKQSETKESPAARKRRPSYQEKREMDSLPALIESLDAQLAALHAEMAAPGFYQQSSPAIASTNARLQELQQQLASAYRRWEELEQLGD
jgi:ATP-binding cassette subfamily F protein uup